MPQESLQSRDSRNHRVLDTFWEEPDHKRAQTSDAQQDEDASGHEDRCKSRLVRQTSAEADGEGEEGVRPHARRQHEGVVGQDPHEPWMWPKSRKFTRTYSSLTMGVGAPLSATGKTMCNTLGLSNYQ